MTSSAAALRILPSEPVTTDALAVDALVAMLSGGETRIRRVAALVDSGRPAVFGTGTEWAVRLVDVATGRTIDLAAATSQRWTLA